MLIWIKLHRKASHLQGHDRRYVLNQTRDFKDHVRGGSILLGDTVNLTKLGMNIVPILQDSTKENLEREPKIVRLRHGRLGDKRPILY